MIDNIPIYDHLWESLGAYIEQIRGVQSIKSLRTKHRKCESLLPRG